MCGADRAREAARARARVAPSRHPMRAAIDRIVFAARSVAPLRRTIRAWMESPVHPGENMFALKTMCVALGLGIVACSSASSPSPSSSEDNTVKVPPFSKENQTRPPSTAPSAPPDKNVEAQGGQRDDDKPATAKPECAKELEPNNETAEATEFKDCVAGELSSRSDADYLKITAPENVTDMVIEHTEPKGKITYTVTIPQGGSTASGSSNFNMSFTDQAPKTKIKAGQTYLFQLKPEAGSTSDEARPYQVKVTFQ